MKKAFNKISLLAAVALGSSAFLGTAQAAPTSKHDTTSTEHVATVKVAAGEKKEVEGTKADVREDKTEITKKAGAMGDKTEVKVKHVRHKVKHTTY